MVNENNTYSQLEALLLRKSDSSPYLLAEVIGQSAKGQNIYCMTVSKDPATYNKSYCQRNTQQLISSLENNTPPEISNKLPIVIIGNIHGHETVGSNALLRLLDHFAKGDDHALLEDLILFCVVCANPDGRDRQTRFNENGFDLNRDFIAQSQPETKAITQLITSCHPISVLDLHGYVCNDQQKLGIIEPCTQPHNPNYEYDLYQKWAIPLAVEMEQSISNNKSHFSSSRYKNLTGTIIPLRDSERGWDDYSPFSAAMYSMLYGALGCTIEAPTRVEDGVLWQCFALLGGCRFIARHKKNLYLNQITFFKRGLQETHFYNQIFPRAYILTSISEDHRPLFKLVQYLLDNEVIVHSSLGSFYENNHFYQKDTFIIKMDQAKSVFANTVLWPGENLSSRPKMTELCTWNLPLLWGIKAVKVIEPLNTKTKPITLVEAEGNITGRSLTTILPKPFALKNFKKATIAIIRDGGLFRKQSHAGLKLALKELGLKFIELRPKDLVNRNTLINIDVIIYNGYEQLFYTHQRVKEPYRQFALENNEQQQACIQNMTSFVNTGGKLIAIGAGATRAVQKIFRLTKVKTNVSGWNDNAIVKVDYKNTPLTYGFNKNDIGFVYRPVWFTNTDEVEVSATFTKGDTAFISGYWPDHHKAQEHPVIVSDKSGQIILIGLEVCFRGLTNYFYPLLVNAIYS